MVAALKQLKGKKNITVVRNYDVAADAKSRISLRGVKTKYFHVTALSNGIFVLEPRVLVAPDEISARASKMLNRSVTALKKGKASDRIDLPDLPSGKSAYDAALPIMKKAWARNSGLPRDLATNPKYMEGFGD